MKSVTFKIFKPFTKLSASANTKIKSAQEILGNTRAFTLTELLIVMAVIALLGTFVAQNVIGKYNKSKVSATKIQIKQMGIVLDDFKRECGFYPMTDQGLEALMTKPTVGRECKNYDPEGYIKGKSLPKDGFGFNFDYTSDGNKYILKSRGNDDKDGGEGLDKDISSEDPE